MSRLTHSGTGEAIPSTTINRICSKLRDYEDMGEPDELVREKSDGWISVDDRLPKRLHAMLVYCPEYDNIYCANLHADGLWWYFMQGVSIQVDEIVTHWRPLPMPPKEERV